MAWAAKGRRLYVGMRQETAVAGPDRRHRWPPPRGTRRGGRRAVLPRRRHPPAPLWHGRCRDRAARRDRVAPLRAPCAGRRPGMAVGAEGRLLDDGGLGDPSGRGRDRIEARMLGATTRATDVAPSSRTCWVSRSKAYQVSGSHAARTDPRAWASANSRQRRLSPDRMSTCGCVGRAAARRRDPVGRAENEKLAVRPVLLDEPAPRQSEELCARRRRQHAGDQRRPRRRRDERTPFGAGQAERNRGGEASASRSSTTPTNSSTASAGIVGPRPVRRHATAASMSHGSATRPDTRPRPSACRTSTPRRGSAPCGRR